MSFTSSTISSQATCAENGTAMVLEVRLQFISLPNRRLFRSHNRSISHHNNNVIFRHGRALDDLLKASPQLPFTGENWDPDSDIDYSAHTMAQFLVPFAGLCFDLGLGVGAI